MEVTPHHSENGVEQFLTAYFFLWAVLGFIISLTIEVGSRSVATIILDFFQTLIPFLVIAIPLAGMVACYQVAKEKNREAVLWGILGLFLGPIAVATVASLDSKSNTPKIPNSSFLRWDFVATGALLIWSYIPIRIILLG